ncbi:hypothetical protein E4T56_gene6958 [Termitomyces sp. T112]|nr:hypothetical protein E4T56_gene6958 [Termitomyces sp. T112]
MSQDLLEDLEGAEMLVVELDRGSLGLEVALIEPYWDSRGLVKGRVTSDIGMLGVGLIGSADFIPEELVEGPTAVHHATTVPDMLEAWALHTMLPLGSGGMLPLYGPQLSVKAADSYLHSLAVPSIPVPPVSLSTVVPPTTTSNSLTISYVLLADLLQRMASSLQTADLDSVRPCSSSTPPQSSLQPPSAPGHSAIPALPQFSLQPLSTPSMTTVPPLLPPCTFSGSIIPGVDPSLLGLPTPYLHSRMQAVWPACTFALCTSAGDSNSPEPFHCSLGRPPILSSSSSSPS